MAILLSVLENWYYAIAFYWGGREESYLRKIFKHMKERPGRLAQLMRRSVEVTIASDVIEGFAFGDSFTAHEGNRFVDKDGRVTGHDGELARLIAHRLNRPIEFHDMKFMALIPSLASGKIDMIVTGMTSTDERRKSINFTRAIQWPLWADTTIYACIEEKEFKMFDQLSLCTLFEYWKMKGYEQIIENFHVTLYCLSANFTLSSHLRHVKHTAM